MRLILILFIGFFNSFLSKGQWVPVGGGFSNSSGNFDIYDLEVYKGELFAVGIFDSAGNSFSQNIAKWTGNHWEAVPIHGSPFKLKVFNNDLILLGPTGFIGPIIDHFVSSWDGSIWSSLDSNRISPLLPGSGPLDLDTFQGELIIAGQGFWFNSSPPGYKMIKWNGSNWDTIPGSGFPTFSGLIDDISHFQNMLVFSGNLNTAGGAQANSFTFYNGSIWSNPATPPFSTAKSTYEYGNALIVDGGWTYSLNNYSTFPYYGFPFKEPETRENIMFSAFPKRVIATDTNLNQIVLGDSISGIGSITCLTFLNDTLFIGGSFKQINGEDRFGIAKWSGPLPSGTLSGFDPVLGYAEFHLNIFPNPASDYVTIEIDSKANQPIEGSIHLSDVNGREVLSKRIRTSKETLNLSNLPPGIYFAKIEVNGVVEYRKVVKE